jgi:hypothetical protein
VCFLLKQAIIIWRLATDLSRCFLIAALAAFSGVYFFFSGNGGLIFKSISFCSKLRHVSA